MGSKISFALRDYDSSIDEAYARLFPGDPDKSPKLLDWRARKNPYGPTRFAVASRGDRIVGMIALIPTRLTNGVSGFDGYQAVDTVVDPSCRGQGLFVEMGNVATDPKAIGADVLWGFPNASASRGWYGRLGWTNFGAVPLLVRPLRSSFVLGRVHRSLRSIDVPLIRNRAINAQAYQDGRALSAEFDKLWRRVALQYGIAVERSGEWMRWRLMDKPGTDYRCIGLKSETGELEAFVATKVVEKHGARLCYVMEAICLPGRLGALRDLLLSELSRAAREGAEAALAWCPKTAPNYRAYRRAGFLPFPPKLRPIEINFGARALVPEATVVAAPDARWYVSLLDSDTN